MLTDGIDAVDPTLDLWISVSEIARQKGVSKQAIAKRVDALVSKGALTTRLGPQNAKLVNIAAYDKAVGETTDAVRAANGRLGSPSGKLDAADPVLAREQARRTSYQAELARLDLEERLGKLLAVTDVIAAVGACAETIVQAVDKLPERANELAVAVGKNGAHGAKACLREIAFDIRRAIERALQKLAEGGLSEKAAEVGSIGPDAV